MRFALLVVAMLTAQAAHAGKGAILIPPVEVDVGVGVPVGPSTETLGPSQEILAGIHWASLAWKPTRFDVGVGYVGSFRSLHDPMRLAEPGLRMHGGYLSLATRLAGGKHWRTWLAARGELLRASTEEREFSVAGGSLRIATELFGAGAAGGRNAVIVGTIAVGFYAEITYRDVPVGLGPVGFTSGVSCRIPFLAAGG